MIKLAISIGTLKTGGAEVFVINLLKHLDFNKYDVMLIVLSKKYHTFLEREANSLPIKIIFMNKTEGFKPLIMYKIYRILKNFSPNVLHGNIGGLIYFLPYITLHKSIFTIHTIHTLANLEFKGVKRIILKYLYLKHRIIPVAISNEVKKSIVDTYHIDSKSIPLINNCVDINKFFTVRQFDQKTVTIGHIGRFEKVKNHETILNVYRKLLTYYSNLKLTLIGDGSLFEKIKEETKLIESIKLKKETSEIAKELRDIDIFFFPSIYEGMPLSLIEAMASGALVIASAVGGIKDIIEDNVNGYLIDDCYDIEGFVNAFRKIINNKDEMLRISNNNIEKAKQYDIEVMVNRYQELYSMEAENVKR